MMVQGYLTNFSQGPPLKKQRLAYMLPQVREIGLCDSRDSRIEELENQLSELKHRLADVVKERDGMRKELGKEKKPFLQPRKPFCDLEPKAQFHKKSEIKKWLEKQFEKLPTDWKVVEVQLEVGMVSFALHFNERVEPEEIDHKKIQRALKAKEDGDVSDSAYHELKMVAGSSLPSLYGIQKERKAQNAIIPITEFEGNAKGCSRSIKDILSYSSDVIGNAGGNVITLRFSGDGRKTTKKLGSVMTTFCFPAENSVKRSPEREYCISIYDGKESYDILKATLRGVFDEMKALGRTGILVNGLEYTIDWVMCADWKFVACILGINSPCALYFCIWCECSKRMIRDFSIPQWPITRTLNQCRARVGCPNAKGVQCLPLVDIEFTKVIPDTLHLKLRIMGKLLNQVACWAIEQNVKKAMEEAIEALGVRFCFYDVQDDSGKTTTKWSSLDCDDLETIIRGLDLHAFLGDMENKSITSLDCLTKA
ncbi:predicted protein [Nematostella vectensis]|uniref:Uncharacterized protein n=1 Tax=Nematostella vectensis TaxID=45351 RepID=A7SVW6_NEMVE|nr:predicted protein [Nematostella vectensis]|eukprot:XP_001624250.1 predicted protein [Nematostella vectensis]